MTVYVVWIEDNGDHEGGKFYGAYSTERAAQIRAWAEWGANVEAVEIDETPGDVSVKAVEYLRCNLQWLRGMEKCYPGKGWSEQLAEAEAFLAEQGVA